MSNETLFNGKDGNGNHCLKYCGFPMAPYCYYHSGKLGEKFICKFYQVTTTERPFGSNPDHFVKAAELIEEGLKASFNKANKTSTNELLKLLEGLKKDAEIKSSFKLLEKAKAKRGY